MGLSEKAVEAVRKWRFEPATLNGEPVAVYYNFTLNFRL
jgi:outer membrane biosynthesis protein TonB